MARLATFFYWSYWLALLLGAGPLRAQTPDAGPGVAVPNAPGLASPPLPPRASPAPATIAGTGQRQLSRVRVLKFEVEPAARALVRRLHPRATVSDSLTALRTVRELVLALQADAYLTASADELHWGRDTVRVRLYVGEQFRWAYLHNGNLGDGLLTRAGYREKFFRRTPWHPADWAALQERVLTEAENQGYPFATVGIDSLRLSGRDIAGRVVLKRGPAVYFDSLQIVGTSKTKKRFLTKYLQLTPGQPYSQQRVDAASALLRQLPYVRLRAEPEVRFAKSRARVYLLLDERPSNQFDAIVGLLPNSNGASGVQFTGDVTINLRNLRGGGKQVGLQWRKTDATSQLLDASYLHPNIFGTPLEVGATFNLYKQTDNFLTIRPRVQVSYPTARAGRLTFFAEQRSSRLLLDSAAYAQLGTLPNYLDSEYNSYGLGYSRASLDDLYFPHRGLFVSAQGGVGTKTIRRNAAIRENLYDGVALRSTQYSFSGRAERYWALGRQGVLLVRARGEGLFNQQFFLNDLFRLGGLNSLRGFQENQFYTNAYGVGTVELRQFTGPEGYVFIFADQALLQAYQFTTTQLSTHALDSPTGLGAGLSFRTAAGLFQFVYSVGRSEFLNTGFSLSNSKIHFGLTSRF
ncbi:BamA/TamA family outer membrane protein [Hymenobacter cheonanensis]|uniref:BamA/TamA family outer membrane protein n=1 Tax=Hymenobacter sp. CA2-7 TaxID=3063993 RepID=UPI002712B0A4|nr:BamA/TamA family outer membrane protein [Hymenobacter sp. CA2-7]MDO7885495.1 BamA/TamA family outer membrane protein [Hymenobacter sp. CA2-7]